MIRRHRTLEGVLAALRADPNRSLPEGYEERVRLADLTFRHQRVWDVANNCVSFLTPMPVIASDGIAGHDEYLGPQLSAEEAYGVCSGMLNPYTRLPAEAATPAPSAAATTATAPAKSESNSLQRYFRPIPRPSPSTATATPASLPRPQLTTETKPKSGLSRRNTVSGAHSSTLAALEEFKQKQHQKQQEQQQQQPQKDVVLAPATPEKGASSRKV